MIHELNFFRTAAVSFALSIAASVALADTTCSSASWFNTHTGNDAANGNDGYCFHTPQAMNIRVYEFGLCTSAASPSDRAQCTPLFSNSLGLSLELSAGATVPLASGVSLAEGTYSHAFVVLSNVTSLETVIEFSSARTDDQGNTGVYCYTDGRSINTSDSVISCGNTPSAVTASQEVIGLGWQAYSNTLLNYTVSMRGETVVSDLYAVTNTGELSTNSGDDFALFGSQLLNQPITITPNTTNIDIGFSITGGVSVGFVNGGPPFNAPARATDAPVDAVFEGLKFLVSAR